jgi:release factor glutamine methyltransferase
MILLEAIRLEAIRRLEAAGVETPRLNAELLLAHVLGRDRLYLYAHPEATLDEGQHARFEELLRRREAREPLPYLLGAWEFMGLPFRVDPSVLIPRPETEVLVEEAARRLPPDARVLDVGAGSGCISVCLAKRLPGARVIALEASPAAAETARRNAAALGVGEQVRVVTGVFPEDAGGLAPLDAVVSNPPYIPTGEVERLPPELRRFEPRLALDGGPDGLHVLRALAEAGPDLLKPGGLLAAEVAQGQAETFAGLLRRSPAWSEPETVPDLAGIARVVLARRR